jgi:hypothetical protein
VLAGFYDASMKKGSRMCVFSMAIAWLYSTLCQKAHLLASIFFSLTLGQKKGITKDD